MNGDGSGDLVVGAPTLDIGQLEWAGGAYFLLGPITGPQELAGADALVMGRDEGNQVGVAVAGLGDVDEDGLDDVAVSGYRQGDRSGMVALYLGSTISAGEPELAFHESDASFYGETISGDAGLTLASAGDLNGDGRGDIAIGCSYGGSQPSVRAYFAPFSGAYQARDVDVVVEASGGFQVVWSVTGAGDVNGDGLDELLVGAPLAVDGCENDARAALFLGPVEGSFDLHDGSWLVSSESCESDWTGWLVAPAGDSNGDGLMDFLVSAPYAWSSEYGTASGAVSLFLGENTDQARDLEMWEADARLVGAEDNVSAGSAIAGGMDADGDGFGDVLVQAPFESTEESEVGAVYLVRGPMTGTVVLTNSDPCSGDPGSVALSDARYHGAVAGGQAGTGLAMGGDVTGDDYADLLIGAPCPGCGVEGTVYIVPGGAGF